MTRQVTDNLYIDLEYFTPEEYYVYEAAADISSASAFTFSATVDIIPGTVIVEGSGAWTSTATTTAQVLRIKQSSSSISSTATVSALIGRIRQINRNPKPANRVGTPVISTAQSKFGGSSIYFSGATSNSQVTFPTSTSYPDFTFGTDAWTIEAWVYPTTVSGTHAIVANATESALQRPKFYISSGSLKLLVNGSDRITSDSTLSLNTWTHVAVSRNASGVHQMFVNGVVQTQTWTNTTTYTTSVIRIGNNVDNNNLFLGYIDDVRISKGLARYTASFTAPTEQLRNDANTVLLLNFNGANNSTTFIDSSGDYLDSASALNASISVIEQFSAALTSTSSLTATVNYTTDNDVNMQAEATLTSAPGLIKTFDIDAEAIASQLTASAKVGQFLVDISAQAQLTAVIGRLVQLERTTPFIWDEEFNWDDWLGVVWDPTLGTEYLPVRTELSADGIVKVEMNADLSSNFSLNANVQRLKQISASLTSSSTVTADVSKIIVGSSALSSSSTVTASASRSRTFISSLDSQATLTALADKRKDVDANLSSIATVNAQVSATKSAQANIASQGGFILGADVVVINGADLTANFTVTAQATSRKSAQTALTSQSQISCDFEKISFGRINLSSNFTQATVNTRIRPNAAALTSQSNLTFLGGKLVGFSAAFTAFDFLLTEGRLLNIDPDLTYVIDPESRFLVIDPETRLWEIEQETKQFIVTEETRVYLVEENTGVNII
jgi:hypothetical protein